MIPLPKICIGCPLHSEHKGFSRLEGDGSSGLMVVAESLGRAEERDALPLRPHAPSGAVFQRAVKAAKLDRSTMTITNIIRCRAEAPYPPEAIAHCRQYLDAAIAERKPRLILALGDVPLKELSLVLGGISDLRGYALPSRYGAPMLSTYHPSHLARGALGTLFGVFLHDLRRSAQLAERGIPAPLATNYNLTPSTAAVTRYIDRLRSDPSLPVAFDIETASILGEEEAESWKAKRPVQIQFSSAVGEALVVPWDAEVAQTILGMKHDKYTWNGRSSDEVLLKALGIEIGGECYDAMLMLSHLQPSFSGGRDASDDEDKGVPARLLNLQSAVSFYYPTETPYKAVMRRGLEKGNALGREQLWEEVRLGGARDVDLTLRLGLRLRRTLERQGLWQGYYRYKHQLGKVLTRMSERGLPIDRERQEELRAHIEQQEQELEAELQTMIPDELKPFKSYVGWPKDLRERVKAEGLYVKCCKPVEFPEIVEAMGYTFAGDNGDGQLRKPLPFNASSSKQILAYIQYRVDEEQRSAASVRDGELEAIWGVTDPAPPRWFVPTHIDTKKPTTNKAGIEALIDATDDAVLKHIEKCKKVSKLKDYCSEKWKPEADARVHAEFRVGVTGTGQTTAINPPIQTYPKHFRKEDKWLEQTARMVKSTIRAPEGYVMIETDLAGFHARMQAFIAEDAAYYRLANLDTHSFLAAHYVGVPDKDALLELDDDALLKRLKEIKAQYDYERNYLCKRISFLNQYGGQAEKAATILRLPRIEVEAILDINRQIFKEAFRDLPDRLERMLKRSPRLVTPFGFPRYFWDGDLNQALAFWVASPAHCVIQNAVIRLDERGALEKYGACNLMHDSLWWCCPEGLAEECIAVAHEEMEQASDVLVNSLGAFTCRADAKWGPDMDSLVEV